MKDIFLVKRMIALLLVLACFAIFGLIVQNSQLLSMSNQAKKSNTTRSSLPSSEKNNEDAKVSVNVILRSTTTVTTRKAVVKTENASTTVTILPQTPTLPPLPKITTPMPPK